jgi:hypothetical protein
MEYSFPLHLLEEKIMDCWNITHDLKVLNSGLQDKGMPIPEVGSVLVGLKSLYEIKCQDLFAQFEEFYPNRENEEEVRQWQNRQFPFPLYDLEEKIMDCWNITNDMQVLIKGIQEKNLSLDQVANVLLGFEYLYELKYQDLFDQYSMLYKKAD